MKKFSRRVALLFAFSAAFSIMLHAGHMDADHLKNTPSHQCGLCKTFASTDVPVATSTTPILIESFCLLVLTSFVHSLSLLSGEDPRGPPLV